MTFDFAQHLHAVGEWSESTFGPGLRTASVLDHIRMELAEIEKDPTDPYEYLDVAAIALDGARRAGATPEQVIAQLVAKHAKNKARSWPDWRTAPADQPITHIKSPDTAAGRTLSMLDEYEAAAIQLRFGSQKADALNNMARIRGILRNVDASLFLWRLLAICFAVLAGTAWLSR